MLYSVLPIMIYPTLKQLQYFVALAEHGHFGHAAEASSVSQSAFSTAIQDLERLLDTQLVDRTNRQVTITATGQDVATQARLVIRDVEAVIETAGQHKLPLTGVLRLGVIPTIAPFLLPAVLPRLRKAYPELRLFLIEDQTERIHQRLLKGTLDLLLLALPYDLRSVQTMSLFKDRFYLAARKGSERVDPMNYRFTSLDADSVLLLEDGHCLRDHALAACKIRNLPEMATESTLLKSTRVCTYPIDDDSYRTIGIGWRKGSAREEEFRLLGNFMSDNRWPRNLVLTGAGGLAD